jgi:hypothetical protein
MNLDNLDAKTMQTHHSLAWDLVNVSKEPHSKIFYYLDGQTPKNFEDLSIRITDKNKNKVEIEKILIDKPYRKEFYVVLTRPVMPKQRIWLNLEYDWEEPERVFTYKFYSGVKKFNYTCMIPKELNLKNRILKVDLGTDYKVHATPPSVINSQGNKTVISWEKSNISSHDTYQFYW